jgi:hypothetical protein
MMRIGLFLLTNLAVLVTISLPFKPWSIRLTHSLGCMSGNVVPKKPSNQFIVRFTGYP